MSQKTTFFGPLVSFRTIPSAAGPVHVFGDSNSTFAWAGPANISGALTSTATIDATAAKFLSKSTTASLTSATLADGEFAVGAVSTTSCIIYIRSGVTTYRILAIDASVL